MPASCLEREGRTSRPHKAVPLLLISAKEPVVSRKAWVVKLLGKEHPHEKVVAVLRKYCPRGRILDAGAGSGDISRKLRDAGYEVTAVDIRPPPFQEDGISWRTADLNEPLPFQDQTFDAVLCANVIEHLENPTLFVRETYRVLKERGMLLVTTPNLLNLKSRMANLLLGLNEFYAVPNNEVGNYRGGQHIHLTNYYELRTLLHRNGFRIIEATTHAFSRMAMSLGILSPAVCLFTWRGLRRERNPGQRQRNREIRKHVLSADLLFGKKLFLLAERDPRYIKPEPGHFEDVLP